MYLVKVEAMAQQSENSQHITRPARCVPLRVQAKPLRMRSRAGHITTFLLFALPIALLAMALVLNWLFAAMVNRRTQHLDDTLARVAVVALLDEEVLQDLPAIDTDDTTDATALVSTYLTLNNAALAARLRPQLSDFIIEAGRVNQPTQPYTMADFNTTATPGDPFFNTLRVKIERPRTGTNPVELIMRNIQGAPNKVDIFTEAYASLDSRITGFAPQVNRPTPLVPLAILDTAWFGDRVATNSDTNANLRKELEIDLLDSTNMAGASGAAPNGALLDFKDNALAPVDFGPMPGQILNGVFPSDLAGGTIMATAAVPFMNVGTQSSPMGMDSMAIVAAFQSVAGSTNPNRIFPLYDSFGAEANLVGFVGATVLSATDITGGGNQIRVRVEPNFIIHVTATTNTTTPENQYIHKIRLTR